MTIATELEQAVAAAINAGTYDMAFTASSALLPSWQREEMRDAVVTVSALSRETAYGARDSDEHTAQIWIAVAKAVQKPTDEHVRPLIALVDQIEETIRIADPLVLEGGQRFAWQSATVDPYYDQELLRDWLVFAAAISITYLSLD